MANRDEKEKANWDANCRQMGGSWTLSSMTKWSGRNDDDDDDDV